VKDRSAFIFRVKQSKEKDCLTLKMKAVRSLEMSGTAWLVADSQIPQGWTLQFASLILGCGENVQGMSTRAAGFRHIE
jgi:hypothetical protein